MYRLWPPLQLRLRFIASLQGPPFLLPPCMVPSSPTTKMFCGFTVCKCYIKRIIQHMTFGDGHFSLSLKMSRSTQVVICICSLILFNCGAVFHSMEVLRCGFYIFQPVLFLHRKLRECLGGILKGIKACCSRWWHKRTVSRYTRWAEAISSKCLAVGPFPQKTVTNMFWPNIYWEMLSHGKVAVSSPFVVVLSGCWNTIWCLKKDRI